MKTPLSRREFISGSITLASVALAGCTHGRLGVNQPPTGRRFGISLAEWSYHNALFGKRMSHLDFPLVARRQHAISAIELVNQFFMDKATDPAYLAEFKGRADGEGTRILLIMCDDEGELGDPDKARRQSYRVQ